jgi:hypothetical protein
MPAQLAFDYAVVRVVPHVDREEFVNVGVILFCREQHFLDSRLVLDRDRLRALAPDLDVDSLNDQFEVIRRVCAGGAEAGSLSELSQAERFRWLTLPRSSTLQISPIHCGLCNDPQAALGHLADRTLDG